MPTTLRLVSFVLAACALAACGPRSVVSDTSGATPTSPVATASDTPIDTADGATPVITDQARKSHGLVARVRPRHRRVLPR